MLLQCYLVKTKSVLNRVMYSWVVHFLSYFISIFREQRRERESRGEGGIVVVAELFKKIFFYVNSFLFTVFLPSSLLNARFHFHLIHPHLIIQCKVSFSSHFILLGGGFVVNINKYK